MFGKLSMFWDALQIGKEVASPEEWKSGQITANKIVLLLTALLGIAHAYGIKINMDTDTLAAIGAGVFALANWLITLATSVKVGLPISTMAAVQQTVNGAQQTNGGIQPATEGQQTISVQAVSPSAIHDAEHALNADRGRAADNGSSFNDTATYGG